MGKLLEYRRRIFSILYVDYRDNGREATIYYTKGGTERIEDSERVTVKLSLKERLLRRSLADKLLTRIDEIDEEIRQAEKIYRRGEIS